MTAPADGVEAAAVTTEVTSVDGLPDFAKTMISELRSEAAKHRTSKGEAVEAAKTEVQATLQAEFDAKLAEAVKATETVKAEASQYQTELTKLKTALGAVDETVLDRATKFAGLLHGVTEDEIKAQAEEVKGLLGGDWGRTPATDPSREGKPLALNDDDGLLGALKRAVGA